MLLKRKRMTRRTLPALALLLCLLTTSNAVAAEPVVFVPAVPITNIFLFNPGELLNGTIAFEHEVALTDWFGISSGFLLTVYRGVFTLPSQPSYVAFGPEVTARFHFTKDAPAGLWAGPSVHVAYIASKSGGAAQQLFGYGLAGTVGYNFVINSHLILQLGGGLGFKDFGDGPQLAPRVNLGLGVGI